ncbi:GNAT family N-acetyltransferase [Plantactinospora sp. KBS50]|uniref:GNAT family N-acetyltransferase n=1 Tax=Plantactinospora sp. KBS50 TaxID=2024580 RepID=UPI000BAB0DCD|nr:GNAT family N-acetyltransferase [Plantactinospora sp. KBS50]ASW55372.1 GNAT family N-acetyltransferase [Plantactinospora sp. KBS50]
MPELIVPTVRLHAAWIEAHREWGAGLHEDGFGLWSSDEVNSPAGFAAWVTRLTAAADPAWPAGAAHLYRWIVEDDRVLGGIVFRYEFDGATPPMGHLGYGVRPSARRRGLASWALGRMLDEARLVGLDRVLIMCAPDNVASARTIEHHGGVLADVRDTGLGPARRYWVKL